MRVWMILAQVAVSLTWVASPTPNATTNVHRIDNAVCPSTLAGGVQIATGLTATSYKDVSVAKGAHYCYWLDAIAPNMTPSVPSNGLDVEIPAQTLAQTTISFTKKIVGGNTQVTVTVSASSGTPTGNITWLVKGTTGEIRFADTLSNAGKSVEQFQSDVLKLEPLTVTYAGNSTFAGSTGVLQ